MSLTTCKECKREVSSKAKTCPGCGAPITRESNFARLFFIAVASTIAILVIAVTSKSSPPPKEPEKQQTREDLAREAASERRFRAALGFIAQIKKSMRNPASFDVDKILTDYEPTLICVRFRAQNGFGGMNRETVVFVKGLTSKSQKDWDRFCTDGSLIDMTFTKRALQ